MNEPRFLGLLGETDTWTDTLQYNTNRELIKWQTKCPRSPEKVMTNFDWEGMCHSCVSYRKRVCQMESEQVIFYVKGKWHGEGLTIFGAWVLGWVLENEVSVMLGTQIVMDLMCHDNKFGWALSMGTGNPSHRTSNAMWFAFLGD